MIRIRKQYILVVMYLLFALLGCRASQESVTKEYECANNPDSMVGTLCFLSYSRPQAGDWDVFTLDIKKRSYTKKCSFDFGVSHLFNPSISQDLRFVVAGADSKEPPLGENRLLIHDISTSKTYDINLPGTIGGHLAINSKYVVFPLHPYITTRRQSVYESSPTTHTIRAAYTEMYCVNLESFTHSQLELPFGRQNKFGVSNIHFVPQSSENVQFQYTGTLDNTGLYNYNLLSRDCTRLAFPGFDISALGEYIFAAGDNPLKVLAITRSRDEGELLSLDDVEEYSGGKRVLGAFSPSSDVDNSAFSLSPCKRYLGISERWRNKEVFSALDLKTGKVWPIITFFEEDGVSSRHILGWVD